jgi:hypothetical protein
MSLTLTINGVDVTQRWRVFESRWTNRAYMGESMQSEFIIDDDTGETYQHSDLATRKIVEVWEDASGTPVCMYRGRVANKTLGRGPRIQGDAMRWTVQTEDYNIDLRGIRIDDSTRPAESDRERVLAYLAGYLSGAASTNPNARDSTDLDGEYVRNASLVDLPAETYTDTFPSDVFGRICDFSAKTFFAFVGDDGTGHLYYAPHDNTYYSSDIAITDDELLADGVDVYNPFRGSQTGAHDGQHLISGGSLRYGSDQFYEYSHAGSETDHDKWEEHFTDEYVVNEGSAQNFLEAMVASRNNEDFNYTVTISMAAEEAHRIKAGMMVPLRLASADLPTESEQRAVQVTHEPVVEHLDYRYLVTIELGVPRGKAFRRHVVSKPGPFEPTPTTPPGPETPGATTLTLNWTFTGTNLDDGTSTYDLANSVATDPGSLTGQWGHQHGGSVQMMTPRAPATVGQSVRIEGSFAKQLASTLQTSYLDLKFYTSLGAGSPLASVRLGIGASGAGLGAVAAFDESVVVPATATHFSILPAGNLYMDDVTITVTNAATPGTPGTPGTGLPEIIGDENVYARADHTHIVFRESAPTATDDEEHGFPEKTMWVVVDDATTPTAVYDVYYLLDNTDGAAVWSQEQITATEVEYNNADSGLTAETVQDAIDEVLTSAGVTDHGALTGLADDDHTQYTLRSILTTLGDLYVRNSTDVTRLGVGSDGQVLTADSSQSTGLKWAEPTSSGSGGEILISDTPSTPLIFADLIQNDPQTDLVYADTGEGAGGGTDDHGSLTGLGDFDHDQYVRYNRIVAGVLRKVGGSWELRDDATHTPIGLASVSADATKITVTYDATYSVVGGVVVTTDESFAEDYHVGASVGLSSMDVYITDLAGAAVDPTSLPDATSSNFWILGIMET